MPVSAIVQVVTQLLQTDVPRDFCTTHMAFQTDAATAADADFKELTDAVSDVWFATSGSAQYYGQNGGKVVAYNRADAKPRPERAVTTHTPASWMSSISWPRQVCLVASFYSARNIKRYRGRWYLPMNNNWAPLAGTPGPTTRTSAVNLVKAIAAAAVALSPSWNLSVHSDVDAADRVVTAGWVNDVWDIQRRRAQKETTRTAYTVP